MKQHSFCAADRVLTTAGLITRHCGKSIYSTYPQRNEQTMFCNVEVNLAVVKQWERLSQLYL